MEFKDLYKEWDEYMSEEIKLKECLKKVTSMSERANRYRQGIMVVMTIASAAVVTEMYLVTESILESISDELFNAAGGTIETTVSAIVTITVALVNVMLIHELRTGFTKLTFVIELALVGILSLYPGDFLLVRLNLTHVTCVLFIISLNSEFLNMKCRNIEKKEKKAMKRRRKCVNKLRTFLEQFVLIGKQLLASSSNRGESDFETFRKECSLLLYSKEGAEWDHMQKHIEQRVRELTQTVNVTEESLYRYHRITLARFFSFIWRECGIPIWNSLTKHCETSMHSDVSCYQRKLSRAGFQSTFHETTYDESTDDEETANSLSITESIESDSLEFQNYFPMLESTDSDSSIVEQVANRLSNITQTHQINSVQGISKYLNKQRSRSMSDISDQVIWNYLTKQRSRSMSDLSDQQKQSRTGFQATSPEITDDESTEHATGIESQIQLEMEAFDASKENELKRRHLDSVCTILRKSEKDIVKVWPGYQEQQPQKPVFVMMTNDTSRGQWDTSLGISIYRRRYDLVSDEAAAVLNGDQVQNNRLKGTEMDHIREVIDEEGDNLFDKHSNITVINGCSYKSYKSKEGGSMLEPTPCVVIHCLVKGIIPFGEDLFPGTIGGIPTDVREGLFYLGVCADRGDNMDGVEEYSVRPDIPVTPGPRGVDFNPKLRMGSGVGLLDCSGRGSIGGFVRSQNGDLGFITCAHVFASPFVDFHTINGRHVTQPADDDFLQETQRSSRTLCGTVDSCRFSSGDVGVDVALVKITPDRLPTAAEFIWASPSDLKFAGFNVPPNFNNGRILTVSEVNARRNQAVVKFGSSTGVTKGSIYLNGTMVRVSDPELFLPAKNKWITFKRQIEICPTHGQSSTFFNLGDSGALVFMLSEGGSELQCIGMAIGYTKTNTCVVTPIEDVFKGLGFHAGQQFQRF